MASLMYSLTKSLNTPYTVKKSLPILTHLRHVKYSNTSTSTSGDPSEESILPPTNEEPEVSEDDLAQKRDISRLKPWFRDVLQGYPSIKEPRNEKQACLAVQRSLYGKYGSNSGVDPAICFMTREEIEDIEEYERVAHTEHILDIRKRLLERMAEDKRQYQVREEQYAKAMAGVGAYKQKIREKILKKMAEAEEAQKKRDTLLEEVKRHFGYTIDPKDEKFQLMLEQKEKEQKKIAKEVKKKRKEEFFMAKLAALESGVEDKDKNETKSKWNKKDVDNENKDDDSEEDEKKD